MTLIAEPAAPAVFDWKRWPRTECIRRRADRGGPGGNAFAAELADRMSRETGTRFKDWVDHFWSPTKRAWPINWRRPATSGKGPRTPSAFRSSRIPAGSFPGSLWRGRQRRPHRVLRQ